MSDTPTLDFDALVKPIPNAEHQGGVPLPGVLQTELERLRKASPAAADAAGGARPAPDLRAVLADATEAFTATSKDIGLLVRIVEANTVVNGAAGLRDGLKLAVRVVQECWDWVHPLPKRPDDASRGNRFKWLNSSAAGAEFPNTVQAMRVVTCGADGFGYFDSLNPARVADLDAALSQCNDAALRANYRALVAAAAALDELAKELKKRLGAENAPDFTGPPVANDLNLGAAVRNCVQFVSGVATKRGVTLDEQPTAAPPADGQPTSPPPPARPAAESREGLYQQLERIAAALKRIEPHSPVPFLIERCVKLGQLPFPDLMRAVIKDGGALTELDRLLGLEAKKG